MKYQGVAFVGPIGAGKTTLADMVVRELDNLTGISSKRFSLGAGIKTVTAMLKYDDKPNRGLWQGVGQGMRGIIGEEVWIQRTFSDIRQWADPSKVPDNWVYFPVVDDVRQPNEVEFFVQAGWLVVGVVAPETLRAERVRSRDSYDQSDKFAHETEINAMRLSQEAPYKVINAQADLGSLQLKAYEIIGHVLPGYEGPYPAPPAPPLKSEMPTHCVQQAPDPIYEKLDTILENQNKFWERLNVFESILLKGGGNKW